MSINQKLQEDLLKLADERDISPSWKPIVDIIGISGFIGMCQYALGDEIYFPKADSIAANVRKRLIRGEFNGYNEKELAAKYNITASAIRHIIKSQK